jgi:hypothetical protein
MKRRNISPVGEFFLQNKFGDFFRTTYNMKGAQDFSNFIFLISPNLAKWYCKQHLNNIIKLEKKTTG